MGEMIDCSFLSFRTYLYELIDSSVMSFRTTFEELIDCSLMLFRALTNTQLKGSFLPFQTNHGLGEDRFRSFLTKKAAWRR